MNQLFERVDLLFTIGFLLGLVLGKFGFQGFELMLSIQVLKEESQEDSIKRILRLPYLKGIPTNQSPKLFTHHSGVLDTREAASEGESMIS